MDVDSLNSVDTKDITDLGTLDIKTALDARIENYYHPDEIPVADDDVDFSSTNESTVKEKLHYIRLWLKPKMPIMIVCLIEVVLIMHIMWSMAMVASAVLFLDSGFIDKSWVNAAIWICGGAGTWMYSTRYDYWNYRRRKLFVFNVAVATLCMYITNLFTVLSLWFVVPIVLKIPINMDITVDMVISLARSVSAAICVILSAIVTYKIFSLVNSDDNRTMVVGYKIDRDWDTRKGKHYKYDWKVVKDKETGKYINVHEGDRTLHAMADGTTGTAKTAGVFTPGIVNDLDTKVRNEDILKKKLKKLVKKGQLVLKEDFEDVDFACCHFAATNARGQKKFDHITSMIRSAGITTLAPNGTFADTIYEFATKRGIRVNRIDPMLVNGKHKPGFKGFNPLYINPKLSGIERKIEIFSKASLFADVSQAIYELNGKGDPYFTSLNHNLSTTIVILLELTMQEVEGKQVTPGDVQDIINDFSRAQRYLDVLKRRPDSRDYQYVIDIIERQLLGENAKKIEEQATGLKVIINELLMHPLVKSVLCAQETVDIDKALEEGQITLVNYALELGQSQATAFGLFFALNFNNAVLRRKGNENTRIPHYYYIDEFPFLLHPRMEQCFTMFRQYAVSTCVALQTLDQLDKNENTKYMRNVLLGNTAHQIFFGRMSPTEMKLLEEMGGKYNVLMEQDTVSQQALSVENSTKTMSKRTMITKDNYIEGATARYKDFMEVTFFTVLKGCANRPVAGKVDFVEKYRKSKIRRYRVNWHEMYGADKAARYGEETVKMAAGAENIPITSNALVHITRSKPAEVKAVITLKNNSVEDEKVKKTVNEQVNVGRAEDYIINGADILDLEKELNK